MSKINRPAAGDPGMQNAGLGQARVGEPGPGPDQNAQPGSGRGPGSGSGDAAARSRHESSPETSDQASGDS